MCNGQNKVRKESITHSQWWIFTSFIPHSSLRRKSVIVLSSESRLLKNAVLLSAVITILLCYFIQVFGSFEKTRKMKCCRQSTTRWSAFNMCKALRSHSLVQRGQ